MKHYKRGDETPEEWPDWVKEADIEWCNYDVIGSMFVWYAGIWNDGVWDNGTWHDGTWEDGTWRHGTWSRGSWFSGTWENGFWRQGDWSNGTWHNGVWQTGVWVRGTWYDGFWHGGVFRSGTWKGGVWYGGNWNDGVWEGGEEVVPRYRFMKDTVTTYRGILGGRSYSLTPEEWYQRDIHPAQRLALKALVLYHDGIEDLKELKPSEGPSVWDML